MFDRKIYKIALSAVRAGAQRGPFLARMASQYKPADWNYSYDGPYGAEEWDVAYGLIVNRNRHEKPNLKERLEMRKENKRNQCYFDYLEGLDIWE